MLPQPVSEEEFDALDRSSELFVQAIETSFGAQLNSLPLKATAVGSYPVFYVGDLYVVKLFSPLHFNFYQTEKYLLRSLNTHLEIPTPKFIASQEIDGWYAILMTRLPGQNLEKLWPSMEESRKEQVCQELGKIIRSLHTLDPSSIGDACPAWDEFIEGQIRNCEEQQRKRGLSDKLARQIPAFLASLNLESTEAKVVLHTEIMPAHLLVEERGKRFQITGLFDFEPAMVGVPAYDFAAIGLFVTQGNPRLLRAFLNGYGSPVESDFHRMMMGLVLLHRYSKLSWYLQFMPPGDSLEELAKSWFGTFY